MWTSLDYPYISTKDFKGEGDFLLEEMNKMIVRLINAEVLFVFDLFENIDLSYNVPSFLDHCLPAKSELQSHIDCTFPICYSQLAGLHERLSPAYGLLNHLYYCSAVGSFQLVLDIVCLFFV